MATSPLPRSPWASSEGAARLLQPLHNTNNPLLKTGVTVFTVLMVTGLIRVFGAGEREQ